MDKQLWWGYLLKFGQRHILQTEEVLNWFRLHPQSKSIQQAQYFKTEEDLLLLSLFKQLGAPPILKEQLIVNKETTLQSSWEILIPESKKVLAAYAATYAERHYVKDDWEATAKQMKLVLKWKHANMSLTEWKFWIVTCLLPSPVRRMIKKLKN